MKKIFDFFVLMLFLENVTAPVVRRSLIDHTANDVFGLIEKSMESDQYSIILIDDYQFYRGNIRIKQEGTILEKTEDVQLHLNHLGDIFMKSNYFCILRMMCEYCKLSSRIIEENVFVSESDVRRQIGFLDNQENCMLTAYLDLPVKKVFSSLIYESVIYFQKIRSIDEWKSSEMALRLDKYTELFFDEFLSRGKLFQLPDTKSVDLLRRHRDLKQKITAFLNTFCSSWRPYVSRYTLRTKTATDDFPNGSPFVRHVLEKEKCKLHLHDKDTPDTFRIFLNTAEPQECLVWAWYCDIILVNDEYRPKYKKQIHKHDPFKIYAGLDHNAFSLAELKLKMKSTSFDGDFVQYYGIAVEVMLLVSIREGYKALKGIGYVVGRTCNKNAKESSTVDEIDADGLKSTLSLLETCVAQLSFQMSDKKFLNTNRNAHKITFDRRVKSLMKALDVQDKLPARTQRICTEIPKQLNYIIYDNFDRPIDVDFEVYYFTEPIRNVTQLYRFVGNNFL